MPVAQSNGDYQDMWVYCESYDGAFLPVSLEMLGEARRLMDQYNQDYDADEKVVALVLDKDAKTLAETAIAHGADIVYTCDHPELETFRLIPATKAAVVAAQEKDHKRYDKPRYYLFPATNNGRDLSATVAGMLDTGLASDSNKLYIEDVEIKHKIKSGSEPTLFRKILHMKRPDFSGFEWSTILCIDNPDHDFHPQCCSVIPTSFDPLAADPSRTGEVRDIPVEFEPKDLRVKVVKKHSIPKGLDLAEEDAVVAVGRGIGDDPTKGIKIGLDLAKAVGGDLGVSRGVVTASYQVDGSVEQYTAEDRQIGETGHFVEPEVYLALGISGAIQHKKGMDKAKFIISVNTEEDTPIKEFSDIYIVGDLFDVGPKLAKAIQKHLGNGDEGGA